MPVIHENGFSTDVRITLEIGGHVLRVAQVGEDSLILRDAFPPGAGQNARIIIMVDGRRRVHPVRLRDQNGQLVFFDDEAVCHLADDRCQPDEGY